MERLTKKEIRKSSVTKSSSQWMVMVTRFHPNKPGQVLTIKNNFKQMKLCWMRRFDNLGSLVIPSNSNCKLERIEGCFANYYT
ncbi:hypothetical protein Cycma_3335 [Cyclobacterium marinum DSM 745]|uniref:Uncharacterized protein n=1 Tax=Cyclobacterium marinum (strain ATCC 25205 / DSM 745 / LMG 13164 / NCIMB 1802) TaxID=880070 RepID=G0IV67_CYCMS|nr:hypothetical protein Cycma_3335 [Cyclobacterium marinum DSM 745]